MHDKPAPTRAADRVRQTARELFYRQGSRAVGVEEVVRRAGVTKPSLYRAYPSKDALTGACVADYGEDFMRRFDAVLAKHPGDARAGVLAWFKRVGERAEATDFRGCGVSNTVVEYPAKDHPGRIAAAEHKGLLRDRLRILARQMGAHKPDQLGDALLLLIEGCYVTGQLFDEDGPAGVAKKTAAILIDASIERAMAKALGSAAASEG